VKEVGGLRTAYDELRLEASANTDISGMEVSQKPGSFNGSGCSGLRLRIVDNRVAITTVTHGFVKNHHPSRVTLMFYDLFSRPKGAFQHFLRSPP
jgi:hypothetical protein